MKKLLLILLCLPMIGFGQLTYVPDDSFEAYLEANGMGDGIILNDSVLTGNINTVTSLNVRFQNITDLTGIEDFTALTDLDCSHNQLTSLDVSNNTALFTLNCKHNILTSLNVGGANSLDYLHCYANQLTSLDVSNNTVLTYLSCGDNQLISLNLSNNTVLTYLGCYNNSPFSLTNLDLRNHSLSGLLIEVNNNPNLFCIDVDNPILAQALFNVNINIDPWTSFSTNCATAFGCMDSAACNYDNIATIDTGICNYNSVHIDTVTSCNLYNWFGNVYTVSGIYDTILSSINSCDSIATLNLTITNSDSSSNNITNCDAYQWNGLNLTNSGTYDTILVNNFGCDSIVNLNLTILNSTTNSTNISVCNEYAWQGNTYYNSGIYIDTITNSFGCDSIMSLNLIINNSPNVVITQNNNMLEAQSFGGASPYDFIWNTGDTTMNIIPQVSGNYWVLSIDANGCVSDTSHFAVFIIANQIEETSSVKNLSKIVNSLGQPLKPVNNIPLFYIYDDGTVEKKIVID